MKKEQAAFGERLHEALRRAQMSENAKELADLVVRHGGDAVTLQAAHRWLRGQSIPRRQNLRALTKVLDVSSEWLLGEDPDTSRQIRKSYSLNPRDRMAMETFCSLPLERRKVVRALIEMLAQPK